MDCPFCERARTGEVIVESDHAVTFFDAYPISPGHTLIVPRRHEPDYFALTPEERQDMWRLLDGVISAGT